MDGYTDGNVMISNSDVNMTKVGSPFQLKKAYALKTTLIIILSSHSIDSYFSTQIWLKLISKS